jgi:hypothetical protein
MNFYTPALRLFSLLIFSTSLTVTQAQTNTSISMGHDQPKDGAVLFLHSPGKNQGLIIPVANRNAINSPESGMVVFDQTDHAVYYHNGIQWMMVASGTNSSIGNLSLDVLGNTIRLLDGTTVISSKALSSTTPSTEQVLSWNGTGWAAKSLSGDIVSSATQIQVTGLLGKSLPSLPAVTQVFAYNGSAWVFQALPTLPVLTTGQILLGDGATNFVRTMAGDATIDGSGIITITNNAITTAKINDAAVTDAKIVTVSASKVTGITDTYVPRSNGVSLINGLIRDDGNNVGIDIAPTTNNKLSIFTSTNDGALGAVNSTSSSNPNTAIIGNASNSSDNSTGVFGKGSSAHGTSVGVKGLAEDGGDNTGINGEGYASLAGDLARGVRGYALGNPGTSISFGVEGGGYGSQTNYGGFFQAGPSAGSVPNKNIGVYGYIPSGPGAGIENLGGLFLAEGNGTTNIGVFGEARNGLTNWAGYFQGNTAITRGLAVGAGNDFGIAGQVLTSSGSGAAPIWTASGLSTTLNSSQVFVGNSSNVASAVTMSGDATLSNAGVLTIANNAITTAKINNGAVTDAKIVTVSASKITGITDKFIPRSNGTSLIDGTIQDDGVNVGVNIAPATSSKFIINTTSNLNGLSTINSMTTTNPNTAITATASNSSLISTGILGKGISTNGISVGVQGLAENGFFNVGLEGIATAPSLSDVAFGIRGFATGGGGGAGESHGIVAEGYASMINYGGKFSAGPGAGGGGIPPAENYAVHGRVEPGIGIIGVKNWGGYFISEASGATSNIGVYGKASNGVTNWAGFFDGETAVVGKLTVGSNTQGNGNLRVKQGANSLTDGIWLDNGTSTYSFWIDGATQDLTLRKIGTGALGVFDKTTGIYTNVSDRKRKKAIEPMPNVLDHVRMLKPSLYRFTNQNDTDEKHLGFIAQEVKDIFPSLVKQNVSDTLYTLDYSGFGVIAIKAIQEQQLLIQELQDQISKLQSKITSIEIKQAALDQMNQELNEIKKLLSKSVEIKSQSNGH